MVFSLCGDHVKPSIDPSRRADGNLRYHGPLPVVLWAYRTTCKRLMGHKPFKLVYGKEAVMPMEYIVPSLCIAAATGMANEVALEEREIQLIQLEEDRFIVGF